MADARIRVAFRLGDLQVVDRPDFQALLAGGNLTDDASFAVLDIGGTGIEPVVRDRCPSGLTLGALELDDRNRLHAVCRGDGTKRDSLAVHGILNAVTGRFEWGRALSIPDDLAFARGSMLLAVLGERPILLAKNGPFWNVRLHLESMKARTHEVPLVFGFFTSRTKLFAVHRDAEVERKSYVLTSLTGGDVIAEGPVALELKNVIPARWLPLGVWDIEETPVFSTRESDRDFTLRLPEPLISWEPLERRGVAAVFSKTNVRPVGGPRTLGKGAFLYESDGRLSLECEPGKKLVLSTRDTRDARASCNSSSCVVVYFSPFQPEGPIDWSRASFHARIITRATCTDVPASFE